MTAYEQIEALVDAFGDASHEHGCDTVNDLSTSLHCEFSQEEKRAARAALLAAVKALAEDAHVTLRRILPAPIAGDAGQ